MTEPVQEPLAAPAAPPLSLQELLAASAAEAQKLADGLRASLAAERAEREESVAAPNAPAKKPKLSHKTVPAAGRGAPPAGTARTPQQARLTGSIKELKVRCGCAAPRRRPTLRRHWDRRSA